MEPTKIEFEDDKETNGFTLLDSETEEKLSFFDNNDFQKIDKAPAELQSIIEKQPLSEQAQDLAKTIFTPIKTTNAEEDFTLLFEDNLKNLTEKTVVSGKVILVTKEDVMVDIGAKAEGIIPINEFATPPKVNEEIKVFIEKLEADDGGLKLSYKIAKTFLAWNAIDDCYKNNKPVTGVIKEIVNNGFIVDIGMDAFLHISQLVKQRITNPELFLQKKYEFKITDVDKHRNRVVLSRRSLLEEREQKAAEDFFNKYHEGDIVKGVVDNFLEFGILIKIEGVTGLLHRTNISWAFISDFKSMFQKDQEITVKILEMNKENKKISLGLKQLSDDPWITADTRYFKDKLVTGKIVKIDKIGITIMLEEGINAFLPASEISWSRAKEPRKFDIGESITAKIIDMNKEKKSIIISLKQKKLSPWLLISEKMKEKAPVEAVVSDIKTNFLILQLFNGLEGLVPRKFASWEENIDLEKHFKIGQTVNCKIIDVNERENKIVLSVKDTLQDPWLERAKKIEDIKTFKCKVIKVLKAGVIVQIDENNTGFIHISQLSDKNIKAPDELVREGDEIFANISNVDYQTRKISLSVIDYLNDQSNRELKDYLNHQEDMDNSLGSFINLEKFFDNGNS